MMLDVEHRLTECEERSKSNTHRLDEVEKKQEDLTDLITSVKVLATREERLETDVKEIKVDVKNLAEKPAKRWDGLVNQIIYIIAAAIIGFVLAKIGM